MQHTFSNLGDAFGDFESAFTDFLPAAAFVA